MRSRLHGVGPRSFFLALILSLSVSLGVTHLTGCGPSGPSKTAKPSVRAYKLHRATPSGRYQSLFLAFEASEKSARFIKDHLVHNLPATNGNALFHVTMIQLDVDQTQSLARRQAVVIDLQTELQKYLQGKAKTQKPFTFKMEKTHTFPAQTRMVVVLPTTQNDKKFTSFHASVYRFVSERIQNKNYQDTVTINPFSLPKNYVTHMTLFKSPYDGGGPGLPPSLLNQVMNTIDQNIKNNATNGIVPIELDRVYLSY